MILTWNLHQQLKLTKETRQHYVNEVNKNDDNVRSTICDAINIFPIDCPDSGCMVCKTYIFINSSLLSYKKWKQN